MIIDFHCHIFSPEIILNREKYLKLDPVFQSMYSYSQAKMVTVEELVLNMDKQNIEKSIIHNLHWESSQICRQTNDYIIQSVKNYRDRLEGFGAIPLDSPQDAIREIEYCAEHGLKGIGELRIPPHFLKNEQVLK
ncbi:MAG TPA: amidohydrolase family protein, partial [Dehalococcoidales bacterium]|nr:amidohydrolase family protein [Dehalococcoidales bacterium]